MSGKPTFIINYGGSGARQGTASYKSSSGYRKKSAWGGRKWRKGSSSPKSYVRKSGTAKYKSGQSAI